MVFKTVAQYIYIYNVYLENRFQKLAGSMATSLKILRHQKIVYDNGFENLYMLPYAMLW